MNNSPSNAAAGEPSTLDPPLARRNFGQLQTPDRNAIALANHLFVATTKGISRES